MNLALPRKAQAWPGVETFDRRSLRPFHANARAPRRMKFFFQLLSIFHRRNKEKSVQPGKIAGNAFVLDNGFDGINGGRMAVGRQLRSLAAVQPFEFIVAIIERVGEVRSGAAGFSPAYRTIVKHDDRFAFARQHVSGAQSGNGSDCVSFRVPGQERLRGKGNPTCDKGRRFVCVVQWDQQPVRVGQVGEA